MSLFEKFKETIESVKTSVLQVSEIEPKKNEIEEKIKSINPLEARKELIETTKNKHEKEKKREENAEIIRQLFMM